MAEEPLPGHREFTISVDFSVVIITICSVCLTYAQEQKRKVFKEVMYFHYLPFLATPQHRNTCPRGHEINNFGRPFLCHRLYMLLLSGLFRGVQKNLKIYIYIFIILLIWPYPSTGIPALGAIEFTILVDHSLSYRRTHNYVSRKSLSFLAQRDTNLSVQSRKLV